MTDKSHPTVNMGTNNENNDGDDTEELADILGADEVEIEDGPFEGETVEAVDGQATFEDAEEIEYQVEDETITEDMTAEEALDPSNVPNQVDPMEAMGALVAVRDDLVTQQANLVSDLEEHEEVLETLLQRLSTIDVDNVDSDIVERMYMETAVQAQQVLSVVREPLGKNQGEEQ